MPRRSSSVVGREFGEGVRRAIEQTNLTHRRIAEMLGWDEAKLSCIVNGKGGFDETELRELLAFCRVKPEYARYLIELFRESREIGYLKISKDALPDLVRSLAEQERLANAITVWAMNLIPGRLQTAEYMRAVIDGMVRSKTVDYEDVIRARLARRELFDWSRTFVFFIHEQALRLPVGTPALMAAQLLHLLTMAERSYITIRIVPTSIGVHAGLGGSFMQLEYDKYEPVVYLEGENNSLFLEDKSSLASYAAVLKLLDRQALDAEQSKGLIKSILI